MKKLLFALLSVAALSACDNRTPEEHKLAETPHVIREIDDCKTYEFEAGESEHYFTRCPNSTVTHEHDWTEQKGKSHVRKQETNVTVSP
jgi:hypothetical protein